jgi:putative MATE family efflux protein
MTFSMVANDAVRAEGNAKIAMLAQFIGSGLNIILDPIFIFGLDMGIRGAAYATVIAQATTAGFLLTYFISGRSEIPMGLKYLRIKIKIIGEIIAVGSASLVMAGAMTFTMALVINTLKSLGSDIEIAAFGIIHRLFSFIFMPIMGLSQGMQPIVGFNYGAHRFHRVKQGIKLTAITATIISSIGFLVLMVFPGTVFRIFSNDESLIRIGIQALRYCVLTLPLIGFHGMSGGLFQALGKPAPALLLSLSRQVLVLIPCMIILPRIIGLIGVWLSFPASDTISFILSVIFVISTMRTLSGRGQR